MNELMNKYKKELLIFIIFILIGILTRIFLSFTMIIIFSLFFSFLVYNIISSIFRIKATITKIVLMFCFIIDLMLLLTGRLNEKYLLIYIGTCAIILIALSKTEGINGLKRGGILFVIYTVVKLIYLMFLIN